MCLLKCKKKKKKKLELPRLVRLYYDIVRNIVLIISNVADCDIYITAFLTCLGKNLEFNFILQNVS